MTGLHGLKDSVGRLTSGGAAVPSHREDESAFGSAPGAVELGAAPRVPGPPSPLGRPPASRRAPTNSTAPSPAGPGAWGGSRRFSRGPAGPMTAPFEKRC